MASKKLGKWSVERLSDTKVALTLPKGMVVSGDEITIDDILHAIATHKALKAGRPVLRCCSGNTAIA
jgi:hypothetical protein